MENGVNLSQASVLSCTQCGGELHPDENQIFVTCPYCGSTVFIDKSRVVFHWYLAPTLDQAQANGALARWMSGSQTVKDLDKKAKIVDVSFMYFPIWYFKSRQAKGEGIHLQPAAPLSVTELSGLQIPAGDLRPYVDTIGNQAVPPSVPLDTALVWVMQTIPGAQIIENALVHIPLFIFRYIYDNQTYTAVVEAATGSVLANIFPSKPEAPYQLAGCLTALVYLFLAMLPIFVYLAKPLWVEASVLIALVLAVIAAPFLFALAMWVATKV
jgi:predicted RNA-binding Zn-ribbon protein involved in translation (DUF1610 family)